jgi:hypothetical protein
MDKKAKKSSQSSASDMAASASASAMDLGDTLTACTITPQMSVMHLKDSEYLCESVSHTIVDNTGPLLIFINNNCSFSPNPIGVLRLLPMHIGLLPAYLERHQDHLKKKGVEMLEKHLHDTKCPAGAGETLFPQDFGLVCTIASLSEEGHQYSTTGKREGHISFCLIPGFIKEAFTGVDDDGHEIFSHVINVYIHIYDVHRRRHNVVRKAEEEQAAAKDPANPPQKRSRGNNAPNQNYNRRPQPQPQAPEYSPAEFVDKVAEGMLKKQGMSNTLANFPAPPVSETPMPWVIPRKKSPDLPAP